MSESKADTSCEGDRPGSGRWILAFALVVGLLRFWKLGAWSLWFDEAATWTDYFIGLEDGEISNPLGYRMIHATVELLGGRPDEFALRFLPALAGFVVIPATAWAFRPIASARTVAIAALLVAASSWQIYWSQNARFYTLAELITLLGSGVFLRGFFAGSTVRTLLGLGIAAASGLFHPSAALLAVALLVAPGFALLRARFELGTRKRLLLVLWGGALVGVLVSFPWAKDTLATYFLQKGGAGPFAAPGEALARVAHLAKTTGFYFTPYLCAAALVGAAIAWTRRGLGGVFGLVVTTIVLLLVAAVAAIGARMTAQYVFFLFPWIALLAASPVEKLGAFLEERRALVIERAWAFVLVACSLVNTGLYFTVRQGERPQWRDAYQFVWNRREEHDLVLGMEATVGEYYLAPWRTKLRQPEHVQWLDKWRATLPELWKRKARRMWLVVNPEQFLDWNQEDAAEVQRFLREECRLVRVWPLYVESRDLSVWVYVRD